MSSVPDAVHLALDAAVGTGVFGFLQVILGKRFDASQSYYAALRSDYTAIKTEAEANHQKIRQLEDKVDELERLRRQDKEDRETERKQHAEEMQELRAQLRAQEVRLSSHERECPRLLGKETP